MHIEYQTAIYSASNFHSNKTNKDYHKIGLILDETAGEFFVGDKVWAEIVKSHFFNALNVTKVPQVCVVTLELKFTEKGPRVDVVGLHEQEPAPKGK